MRRVKKESPMKTKLSFVAVALLFSVITTGSCYAQQTGLDVKIPFAFQAGNHTLPAGEYRVERAIKGTELSQRIRQVDGDAVTTVQTMLVEAKTGNPNPKLVFNRYGHAYFLSQIWTGDARGRQLFKSDHEKEMARQEKRTGIALLLQPTSSRPKL
jgi:hypothetical protein